jgi:dethiobiotin synthetase
MKGVFITGSSTEVGKTFVAAEIARLLKQQNINIIPRKPIESGCIKEDGQLIPRDAARLKQAAAYSGALTEVCPFRFEPAISPLRAARLAKKFITTQQLADACRQGTEKGAENGFLLVEGAGGFYTPLAENGLNADLAEALQLPVLLVAEDHLGVINQALLNAEAIQQRGLYLLGVVLNDTNNQQTNDMDNLSDLSELLNCPVYSSPYTTDGNAILPQSLIDSLLEIITTRRMPGYFQPVYNRWGLSD